MKSRSLFRKKKKIMKRLGIKIVQIIEGDQNQEMLKRLRLLKIIFQKNEYP